MDTGEKGGTTRPATTDTGAFSMVDDTAGHHGSGAAIVHAQQDRALVLCRRQRSSGHGC